MPFMKFSLYLSPIAVLGKDPASPRPEAQSLMFEVYSFLLHSAGFMPLYSSWYGPLILSGKVGAYESFVLFSPLLERNVSCNEDGHTWQRLMLSFLWDISPVLNIGLNIWQNLSLWIIVLQMYSILYSTSWQTHSLIVHLVKNPHTCW